MIRLLKNTMLAGFLYEAGEQISCGELEERLIAAGNAERVEDKQSRTISAPRQAAITEKPDGIKVEDHGAPRGDTSSGRTSRVKRR